MARPLTYGQYIHCGFELKMEEMSEESQNILRKHVTYRCKKGSEKHIKLDKTPYTSIIYRGDHMFTWFNRNKNKETCAYIYYLYIDVKKQIIIGQGTINGEHMYITLTYKTHLQRPYMLKMFANRGDYGPRIQIDPIKIPVRPYIYHTTEKFIY